MNIVVPVGRDTLYVVRDLEVCDEGTAEDKLRKCGRELLDRILTPYFGWSTDGRVNFLTKDPIGSDGDQLVGLLRTFYEDRQLPPQPCCSEHAEYLIHDFMKPSVQVLPFTHFDHSGHTLS
jgi:hypothetical protein